MLPWYIELHNIWANMNNVGILGSKINVGLNYFASSVNVHEIALQYE